MGPTNRCRIYKIHPFLQLPTAGRREGDVHCLCSWTWENLSPGEDQERAEPSLLSSGWQENRLCSLHQMYKILPYQASQFTMLLLLYLLPQISGATWTYPLPNLTQLTHSSLNFNEERIHRCHRVKTADHKIKFKKKVPHQCDKCDAVFKSEHFLEIHMRRIHGHGSATVMCSHCAKEFPTERVNLKKKKYSIIILFIFCNFS